MDKILGLDLGTNSIGWAIVERDNESNCKLIDKGVHIFQEGVKIEKGVESSKAAERTQFRASRRHYFRRKLRKIETLKALLKYDLCPYLSEEALSLWLKKNQYPLDDDFIAWQRTNENDKKNPYYYRHVALTKKLDFSKRSDRFILGRALYHLSQRRGFLSNRLELTKESEGDVKKGIDELNEEMEESGCEYLGDFFYKLYGEKKKIRNRYVSRISHYRTEFYAICERQELPDDEKRILYRAIFFQRPLKSQKGRVGKCPFEKNKTRCAVSHPRFEEFRMLSFINNIKIKTPADSELRPLSEDEKMEIFPVFLRKSKPNFPFEDIAKRIAGKGNYSYYKDENDFPYVFNYPMYQSVSGCPTTAQLIDIFGANWVDTIKNSYVGAGNKNDEQIINDIWHVLRTFTDEDKLVAFGKCKLGLSGDDALKFSKISMRDDYASLSLNAINKILPYLRDGLLYSHSVFLANMGKVVPAEVWNSLHDRKIIIEEVVHIVNTFSEDDIKNKRTIEGNIGDFLSNNFNLSNGALDKLYHPSMIDTYPDTLPDEKGIKMLGSPRTDAIRNPMAMRAFFRLRALVNALIKEGKIDSATKVNIEFARELNDANKRKAIERYQRDREAERKQYVLAICEHLPGYEPSEDDLLKYRLWEEQNHKCLYTGKEIALTDFIGANPKFDIEHTIPRSSGGDDSIENKTLCDSHFNRDKKGTKIPSQLDNHSDIMARIGKWKDKYEQLDKEIDVQVSRSKRAATKEAKDAAMQQKHYLIMQRNYWRSKYGRFEMAEVPSGFKNSQGVDNSIIAKYGRLYLKTVFPRTYTVKGLATADFRKLWGLQDEYAKKERVNHVHHCIDAITIACIGRKDYDYMAHYFFDLERYRNCQSGNKPEYPKPWPTFTEDVKNIDNSVLVSHYTPDNLSKQSKRKLRVKGKIQYDTDGNPKYEQGDTVRGELHQSTFYGAIMRNDELKYVVRKNLGDLKESDVAKIVDDVVKEKIQKAIVEKGFKKATSEPVWMNEGKGVQIKKVRCFTPSIVKPIHLKKQRDLSKHDYKQDYYVANDNNYCMAIYEGLDCDGKLKRDFAIINNLDAAKFYKKKRNNPQEKLFNEKSKNGFPLKYILKKGTMVLFWEKDPSEIWSLSKEELKNRLYKVIGMTTLIVQNKYSYGMLDLKYHQEARIKGELNPKKGLWLSNEKYRPLITINHNQFNAIVQGYDFEFSVTGEITPIKR